MASQWLFTPFVDVITNAPYANHIVIAATFFVVWLIFHRNPGNAALNKLTDEERAQLIEEWVPEPLVDEVPVNHPALHPRIIRGKASRFVDINGSRCLNMATHNYLNLVGERSIEDLAIAAVQKYGVGSCGPRGFYGTMDVHLDLEERLARFMDMEEAVVYSYNFSTIASAIPAYAKRGDIVFADEEVHFAVQKGLDASRSKISYFKHNDMDSLEKLLKQQELILKKNPARAKVTRQFLVVEGIYLNSGDICPLPRLIELRKKYKLRLIIDETVSFGTLGEHGRGVIEHFNIPRDEVDLVVCSMEHAMATIGGFCVGTSFIVDHQRLSGLGYCFSASLPPALTSAAVGALDLMEEDGTMFNDLKNTCLLVDQALRDLAGLVLKGDPISPVKHLSLAEPIIEPDGRHHAEEMALTQIVDVCLARGVAFIVAVYLEEEVLKRRPTIRVTVNKDHSPDDITNMAETLQSACDHVLLPLADPLKKEY